MINDPWMSMGSYYNPGFYNPYSSWNYYSPSCASIIYNNAYPYYNGYYDAGRKNVVYAPRTGGYNNSNHSGYGNSNYNSTNPSNTTNTGVRNNTQYPSGRQPNTNTNSTPPNTYRYNKSAPASNPSNWNSHNGNGQNSTPSNNGNSNEGGIRIGTRHK